MNTSLNYEKDYFGGPVELGYYKNGIFTPEVIKPKNLVLYGAQDILGKLIAGDTDYLIKTSYFEFINDPAIPSVTPTESEGQSYYDGLTSPQDFIRSSIISQGETEGSDADHDSNVATLFAVTSGSSGVNGVTFNNSSNVYGAALVASPTGVFSGDIVFARVYFDTALPKMTNSQIAVKWTITFPS